MSSEHIELFQSTVYSFILSPSILFHPPLFISRSHCWGSISIISGITLIYFYGFIWKEECPQGSIFEYVLISQTSPERTIYPNNPIGLQVNTYFIFQYWPIELLGKHPWAEWPRLIDRTVCSIHTHEAIDASFSIHQTTKSIARLIH